MVERKRDEAAGSVIPQVGFAGHAFGFQPAPLALMKDHPDKLDLASPSICFQSSDLGATRAGLDARGVNATDINDHHGMRNSAFCDNENRCFAVAGYARRLGRHPFDHHDVKRGRLDADYPPV